MKERPLLFTAPMVRAILAREKSHTRRPIKRLLKFGDITEFQPSPSSRYDWTFRDRRGCWNDISTDRLLECCPYGVPGDRIWVKETFAAHNQAENRIYAPGDGHPWGSPIYRATFGAALSPVCEGFSKWKASIHMPRWASRILLEVKSVRPERVRDISRADAAKEGICYLSRTGWNATVDGLKVIQDHHWPEDNFQRLWDLIHGKGDYRSSANPWTWVIEFDVLEVKAA